MTALDHTHTARRAAPRPKRRVSAQLRDRLGDNLRALRHALGLTQAELAARGPCHPRLISDLENSRYNATLATLEMLALALNCCESDLLRRGPPPPAAPGHSAAPGHGLPPRHPALWKPTVQKE